MNPILLRYVGFALAAVIAGAGGGYLAVNNGRQAPPQIVQSGTIPAIPAQPFPGEWIPAIPAIPAIPPDKVEKQRANPKDPIVNGVWTDFISAGTNTYNWHWDEVGAGKETLILGKGFFASQNNQINWDGIPIGERTSASPWGYTATAYFILMVPSNAQPGETHTVSVTTPVGTSEAYKVKVVEYLETEPTLCGISPSAGTIGTKIEVCIQNPKTQYRFVEENYYLYLKVPASLVISGAEGSINVAIEKPLQKIGEELYAVQIPNEFTYCPVSLRSGEVCIGSASLKTALPAGTYNAKVSYNYVFPYKSVFGVATEPEILSFYNNNGWAYGNDWDSQFTLTVQ